MEGKTNEAMLMEPQFSRHFLAWNQSITPMTSTVQKFSIHINQISIAMIVLGVILVFSVICCFRVREKKSSSPAATSNTRPSDSPPLEMITVPFPMPRVCPCCLRDLDPEIFPRYFCCHCGYGHTRILHTTP